MMIANTCFVSLVTMVRSESLVGLQIVFSDSLVSFANAPRAKHNVSLHVSQVVQTDRQTALDRNQIDDVYHCVDARQAFSGNHAAQQRLRRTAIARWIL